jgi:Cd2+/Zn2+-exporting ATPase
MKEKYTLKGLDCPSCAAKIQQALVDNGIEDPDINFVNKSIRLRPGDMEKAQRIAEDVEPHVLIVSEDDHDHAHEETWTKLIPIGVASLLFIAGFFFKGSPFQYILFSSSYLVVGWEVLWSALRNILKGRVFDENFLMAIATIGAIAIDQFPEAVGVMLFYNVGEFFQSLALHRSRKSIEALMDIRPDYANLRLDDGSIERVAPEDVDVDQIILIRPGERIPLDGRVIEGSSHLDTSALTGESVPRRADLGDEVLAGMVNTGGLLTLKVTRHFKESSVARILALVEEASDRKAPTEQFITRFSRYYTPVVVIMATLIALIPPLVIPSATYPQWIYRALTLLVISCPCALVISIPLGYFGGIGGASREGILIKGANFLDAIAHLDTVVFDKTGTLTEGVFKVSSILTRNGFSKDDVLKLAAVAETHSSHPIATSILAEYSGEVDISAISHYEEIPGHGVEAVVKGQHIIVGNDRLLHQRSIEHDICEFPGADTVVYVVVDGILAGYITISDELKTDAIEAVEGLRKLGTRRLIMLTGDSPKVAEDVATRLGLDRYYAGLLPEEKVAIVEELYKDMSGAGKLAFIGDGINDAPVLTRADVGIAMGGLGSDAAIEAADVVIMEDMPSKVATAVRIAGRTRRIVLQNIVFALAVKIFFIIGGAFGLASMWEAVFADVGVAIIAILNSTRALTYAPRRKGSHIQSTISAV